MSDFIQVFTTTARKQEAEQIARTLVEERLAACVQILGPITSTYHWQGAVETSEEWLCLIKSRQELFAKVEAAICRIHPYEVPEIVALPIVAGSQGYLTWLQRETGGAMGSDDQAR